MKYKLEQKMNPQQPGTPRKWYATAVPAEKITTEEIGREIAGRTTVSLPDTVGTLRALREIIPKLLLRGATIQLEGIGTFRMGIKSRGVDNPNDFDISHICGHHIIYTPDARILDTLSVNMHYEDSGLRGSKTLSIHCVTDMSSNRADEVLTAGGTVRISGQKIKLMGDDPSVGLVLIHDETHREHPVPPHAVPVNRAREIIFVVPLNLPAGRYRLRIATQYSRSAVEALKRPRSLTYDVPLTLVT
ncbi:MAG: DUF4469 domain-containing protein [Tannerellaceae bacterium]|jgi:predicted histone-like DNA-binding protein|nr:DUF4469 domain-containing protein [Tannerellaceae bacterium]